MSSEVYGFEVGIKTSDLTKAYGFEVGLIKASSQVHGFEIGLHFDLTVNVIDNDSNPLSNQTIQVYDTNDNLLDSVFTASGSWYFSLFEAGTYKISTNSSDRMQEVVFDGETPLEENFIVKGLKLEYRVKATGLFGDSDWSNVLEVNI